MVEHDVPARPPLGRRELLTSAGLLSLAALAVALAGSFLGQADLTWAIWRMRLFRLAAAATVGAGLGAAGAALQGLMRNPLAEPYILGISSGAGVGVVVGSAIAGWGLLPVWLETPMLAFVGALATCGIVYALAQHRGRLDPYGLLLSGVIVNVFNGAVMLAILLVLDPNRILEHVRWSMGDPPQWIWSRSSLLLLCAGLIILGWVVLVLRGLAFNALGLGDDVAESTGVAVHRLRFETFVVVGMMTAAAVSLAGPIGFVGLIVPHICRLLVGPDHRRLLIYSGFAGAILLMATDTFCRTVGPMIGVGKIPVGVVTALAGGPFFIYLLRRRFREAWA